MTGPDKLLTISLLRITLNHTWNDAYPLSFPVRMQHVCVKSLS